MRAVVLSVLLALWIATPASAEDLLNVDPEKWTFQKVDNPTGVANEDIAAFALTVEQCPKLLIGTRDGDGLFVKDIGKELDLQCRTALAPPKHGDARRGPSPEPWQQAFAGSSVRQIAMGSGIIVAAVSDGTALSPQTLYRSLDGGEQWEVAYRLPGSAYVRDTLFVRAYEDSGLVIASIRDGGESYYIRSTDKGESWQRHEYGDVFVDENPIIWDLVELSYYEKLCPRVFGVSIPWLCLRSARRSALFMSGEYGGPKGEDYQPILLKSENSGVTWSSIVEHLPNEAQWHAVSMDVDTANRRVYHQCEGGATAWSDDSGATWSFGFFAFMYVAVDPATGGLVLARIGDDGGRIGDVYVMQMAPSASNTFEENLVRITDAVSAPEVAITGGEWLWAQSHADGLWVTSIPREAD
jgi:hypothetical protein